MTTVVGHHFYRDGTKLNENPRGASYALRGLFPATEYPDLTATSVSMAGVESEHSEPVTGTTLEAPPPHPAMSQADKDAIDAVVAASAPTMGRTGVMVSVSSPEFGDYEKAYGTSDLAGTPMTTDMHFRVASMTKSFTAAAVMMAADKGLLSLDDTIDKYMSWVPNGDKITIRLMLMHRSGLANDQTDTNYGALYYTNPTRAYSVMSSLLFVRRAAPLAPPDTVYGYTNTAYFIAGMILERVTGRKLKSLIEDDIMAPLGMTGSTFPEYPTVDMPAPFSHGYAPNLVGANSDWYRLNPNFIWASGNIVSTIGDLVKWGKELRDGTLLSPAMHHEWVSTYAPFPYRAGIKPEDRGPVTNGMGMGILKQGDWIGHDGSWTGYSCACAFHPASGTVITAMENAQTYVLTAWAEIFTEIAEHFYPGSAMGEFTGTWPPTP
ncbi:serine hydrolase domain-containing protein [Mycobacterium intracellulare]|uniref:Serine hydrolase domain-containing protein n=1 Tax=Mycobacterium intracellulare TaxID=1767 RepID=A0AAE4U7R8_MYCIT|nr:serine hydrolase domain-containing protein [Mycobacterium intracellulare]MDV6975348.1 serine hydrolase domain-containing protein [Mycobacterium intracellulare]MDV6980412.1 serine hydrolase domain-containing protein [Mycobacterium intracellulare]MDV7010841.1 serine hydrolase domain-containing protein [Mycobacterium intracellulare]MDV7025747.1 serine hydrolase domain-containing protein [Mycobacterium intracellulare]